MSVSIFICVWLCFCLFIIIFVIVSLDEHYYVDFLINAHFINLFKFCCEMYKIYPYFYRQGYYIDIHIHIHIHVLKSFLLY